MGLYQLLKLASVILFILGFTVSMQWLDVPLAGFSPYVVMAIAAGLAFIAAGGFWKWIGAIVFVLGFSMQFGYIDLNDYIQGARIGAPGLMVTGYLFIFFN